MVKTRTRKKALHVRMAPLLSLDQSKGQKPSVETNLFVPVCGDRHRDQLHHVLHHENQEI